MASTEPFLSASWYRVGRVKPKLREHVRVRLHRYRGRPWCIVSDPVSGRLHRLAPAALAIVAAFDGTRTLDDIWLETAQRFDDGAPTQDQVINLLGQLHTADLLQGDTTPDTLELFERFARNERSKFWRTMLNPLSVRVKLWNPDRFLDTTMGIVGPLFGWGGALLWLAIVLPALFLVARHWPELSTNIADRALGEANLALLALTFPIVKALHEFGHAYATKRFGGEVHDIGVMFLVLFPMPYVDASAAAGFRSKWRRTLVGAAGMLVEIFLAALATYVWVLVEPGVVRAIAFDVMLMAGVTTVLFNGNPLLRYDGYYILTDLLEIPNLGQRANRYWQHLTDLYLFGVEAARDPAATLGERFWLLIYAPAAYFYRFFIMISIAFFLIDKYFVIGAALAMWSLVASIVLPVARGLWYVAANPKLARTRKRAVGIVFGGAGAIIAMLLWIPAPFHTVTEGVVWLPETAVLRARTNGFVERLLMEPGAHVHVGETVMVSDEPVTRARLAMSEGRVAELEARLEALRFSKRVDAAVVATELMQVHSELAREQDRIARLVVRSGAEGVLAISRPRDLPGRYLHEGDLVGYVLPDSGTRIVRVTVGQDDVAVMRQRLREISVKIVGHLAQTYSARLLREVPAGLDELPSKALAVAGGGSMAVDPRDTKGTKTIERIFHIDIELSRDAPADMFGARAHVRFDLAWEPLGTQIYRRLRQLLLARLQA